MKGTITIKTINKNITPAMLLKSQLEHYEAMKKSDRFECRSFARQQLFNLKKQQNAKLD